MQHIYRAFTPYVLSIFIRPAIKPSRPERVPLLLVHRAGPACNFSIESSIYLPDPWSSDFRSSRSDLLTNAIAM